MLSFSSLNIYRQYFSLCVLKKNFWLFSMWLVKFSADSYQCLRQLKVIQIGRCSASPDCSGNVQSTSTFPLKKKKKIEMLFSFSLVSTKLIKPSAFSLNSNDTASQRNVIEYQPILSQMPIHSCFFCQCSLNNTFCFV